MELVCDGSSDLEQKSHRKKKQHIMERVWLATHERVESTRCRPATAIATMAARAVCSWSPARKERNDILEKLKERSWLLLVAH